MQEGTLGNGCLVFRGKLGVRSSWLCLCGSLRTRIGTLLNHHVGVFNSSRRDRTGQRAVRTRNLRDLLLKETMKCHLQTFTFVDTCVQNKFSKVLIFAHMPRSQIMRKFAPFENFQLYGTTCVCEKPLLFYPAVSSFISNLHSNTVY